MSSTIETALILALDERHGPVSKIMRAGLLTAIRAGGRRTDLPIVPPDTGEQAAQAAMEQAAQAGNRTRTPALLAAIAGQDRQATDPRRS
jgi:hypothetical protein